MELVVKETRRPHIWYYCDGKYISKDGDVVRAKIRGADLVNPSEIRLKRMEIAKQLPINQRGSYRIEPDDVTKALWDDWQARQSVG